MRHDFEPRSWRGCCSVAWASRSGTQSKHCSFSHRTCSRSRSASSCGRSCRSSWPRDSRSDGCAGARAASGPAGSRMPSPTSFPRCCSAYERAPLCSTGEQSDRVQRGDVAASRPPSPSSRPGRYPRRHRSRAGPHRGVASDRRSRQASTHPRAAARAGLVQRAAVLDVDRDALPEPVAAGADQPHVRRYALELVGEDDVQPVGLAPLDDEWQLRQPRPERFHVSHRRSLSPP